MSKETEHAAHKHEAALAFLCADHADELTDILVDALESAVRILDDEIAADRLN